MEWGKGELTEKTNWKKALAYQEGVLHHKTAIIKGGRLATVERKGKALKGKQGGSRVTSLRPRGEGQGSWRRGEGGN